MPVLDPCNITTQNNNYPCLDCNSVADLELLSIFIIWFNGATGPFNGPPDWNSAAPCYTCLSKKKLMELIVGSMLKVSEAAIISNFNSVEGWDSNLSTIQNILNLMKCGKCSSPRQRQAAIAYYLCYYWNNLNRENN